jgi:hypothetical protein
MRLLAIPFLLAVAANAQAPAKIFTFNQADKEHCKVVVAGGKPLLESTYEGTSVAIAMPVNTGTGEFLVFIAVSRMADGTAQVDPKEIYGVFSDPAHSRFTFYDKGPETRSQARPGADPGLSASNAQLDPGSIRPGQVMGGGPPDGGSPGGGMTGDAGSPGSAVPGASVRPTYLHKGKVRQGEKTVGWVTLRQAKGATVEVHPNDMLDEIDIPVNGVVFRF